MFSELLSELVPGAEHPEDLEMLVGVAATSQEMQDRVLELVGQVGGDWWGGVTWPDSQLPLVRSPSTRTSPWPCSRSTTRWTARWCGTSATGPSVPTGQPRKTRRWVLLLLSLVLAGAWNNYNIPTPGLLPWRGAALRPLAAPVPPREPGQPGLGLQHGQGRQGDGLSGMNTPES